MNHIIAFLKKKDLYLGITRYMLGLWMLTYGVAKILKVQFVLIPFSLWQRPLETLSGRNIAWAFLGYSSWFQILLGFLETVPSILLLFRRTSLLGGVLMLPMTLGVFLINHALNLWDATKEISLILLCLNCLFFIFEWRRIRELLLIIWGKGLKYKFSFIEISLNLLVVVLVTWYITTDLLDYKNQTNVLTGDWYNKQPNEWVLQSEKLGDSILRPHLMKTYFGAYGEYSEINDTGYVRRNILRYEMDEKSHQLNFYNNTTNKVTKYNFSLQGDTSLRLSRIIDSAKNKLLTQRFKRRVIKL